MQKATSTPLDFLCREVREAVAHGNYTACMDRVCNSMAAYPDAPQPHNLMGILLEKQGNHTEAMRHFRAAWALDPTYTPAEENLETYATFYSHGQCAFDESDCKSRDCSRLAVDYDTDGIGHIVRKDAKL